MMGPQLSGWTKSGRQLIAAEVVLFFKKKKGNKKEKRKNINDNTKHWQQQRTIL
jgi:hypothetical protein